MCFNSEDICRETQYLAASIADEILFSVAFVVMSVLCKRYLLYFCNIATLLGTAKTIADDSRIILSLNSPGGSTLQ